MKLFLLTQHDSTGYDTYDSCVVCAKDELDAKSITPSGRNGCIRDYSDWAHSIDGVICDEIGEANDKQVRGVICSSFNAG